MPNPQLQPFSLLLSHVSRRSALLRVMMLLPAVASTQAADDLLLRVSPGSQSAIIGGTMTVDLAVANLSNAINGVQAFIHYDPSLLALQGIEINANGPSGWTGVSQENNGTINIVAVILGGSTLDDQVVAALSFRGTALGATRLTFVPDNPPIQTKLTRADDSTPLSPTLFDSEVMTVVPGTVPAVSPSGAVTLSGLVLIIGVILVKRRINVSA